MRTCLATPVLIGFCSFAGFAAQALGLPLPFMLGPLVVSGLLATAGQRHLPRDFPGLAALRIVFIAVIGLMIGEQIRPELFHDASRLALSFAALTVFVGLALAWNYTVFRRLGGYDTATAFYSSTPGGLYESIAFGEEAGADPARLILQQFLRVIMTVTILPIALSLWTGAPVGSAGGMSLARADVPWSNLPLIALAIAGGIGLGIVLRLPARQLTGPMAAGMILSMVLGINLDIPQWLVNLAQIVVGTALGMRFKGIAARLILRGMGLSVLSVGGMLILAALMAFLLAPLTGLDFDVMLISFAPGGVTEMALVALSLQANPAVVTLHHIYRIILTIIGLVASAEWLRQRL